MRRLGGFAICLALLWLWMGALGFQWAGLPPLGRFASPFEGFWRNAEGSPPKSTAVTLEGLSGTVVAEYDKRGVAHVFAPDLQSLFYAQGYATARDRLWQMDIQSRAGMGRLAEIMGPKLLRFDLERRRMGMAASAVTTLEYVLRDSLSRVALEAYAQGVNAWISSLKPASYPLEFKLLGYAPEPWTPLKSIVMLKNMQWTLSQGKQDVPLTRTLDAYGRGFFAKLYPLRHPGSEPILPEDVYPLEPKEDSAPAAPLPAPAPRRMAARDPSGGLAPEADSLWPRPNPASGSNNFVIAGKRTRSGYPILANDPHLDLTLPSLWYEIQLKSGSLNGYGVSLPGLPGIVIGFTRSTAWGLTNGMDDVFDWFELKFQNDSLNHYAWKSRWRATYRVLDTIPVRGAEAVVDTQLWSHLGPIPVRPGEKPFTRNTPPGHGLKWTALDPSNELGVFLRLLGVADHRSFRRVLRDLQTPSQNVVYADREDIALVHQGRIPAKKSGQGRLTARGAVSAQDWKYSIPQAMLPAARNPARGWLASANQEVTGPRYPYYLGSEFYPPERSQRLHRLLANEESATLPSAWNILRDDYSRLAARALPLLLRHLPEPVAAADSAAAPDTSAEARATALLRTWDFRYRAAAAAPVYFDLWWKLFYQATWSDDFKGDSVAFSWPSRPVTVALLAEDSASEYFDDVRTPGRETAGDLARSTFAEAVRRATKSARPDSLGRETVSWGVFRPLSIPHLLRLAPLGVSGLAGDGCGECLNAQRGSHGPSWRMAVQIGKRPEAWGIYPGGQSGNPGSRAYDAFVQDWLAGRAYRLLFLNGPLEVPDSTAYLLTLWGKR